MEDVEERKSFFRGKSSHRGGRGRRGGDRSWIRRKKDNNSEYGERPESNLNADTLQMFQNFQQELDIRYDKHERLVKTGRDITIESKRIIFLLHRIISNEEKADMLKEAEQRLEELRVRNFAAIAEELEDEDPYLFLRAYSPGLQEYVEAHSYYRYLKDGRLMSLGDFQKKLSFTSQKTSANGDDVPRTVQLYIPPSEYILGLADLTGELMRKCINSICVGDVQTPFALRLFMTNILEGFLLIGNDGPKDMRSKLNVMQQSMSKVENACYAVQVRQTEFPEYKLSDVLLISHCADTRDKDEDYYSDY